MNDRNRTRVFKHHHVGTYPDNWAILLMYMLVMKMRILCFNPQYPLNIGEAGPERTRNMSQAPPCSKELQDNGQQHDS